MIVESTTMLLLISSYVAVNFVSAILLFTIAQFSKKKPFGKQFVTNRLSVDFALVIFTAISIYAWTVIARLALGPLDETILNVAWCTGQFFMLLVSMYMLSMQTAQFMNIFCSSW